MEITEEERAALKSYSMYNHVQINAMINYNPELLDELSDLYHLDFSKENVKKYLEDIKKMYSAMYKYTKNNKHESTVYRGTSIREVSSLNVGSEYNQLLSTSADYKVANNFAANHYSLSPARLDIDMKDAVYIYMPYALDGDSDKETIDEKELLIAPFSKIDSIENGLSFGGVLKEGNLQSYRVSISKCDFKDVPKSSEIDRDEVIERYSTLPSLAKKYFETKQKINQLDKYYSNNWDKTITEEYYDETKAKYMSELTEIKDEISSITSGVQTYLKASFRDIEKEIDKNIIEENKKKETETSKDEIAELSKSKDYNVSRISTLISDINSMQDMLKIDGIQDLKALGIDTSNSDKDLNSLRSKLEELKQTLEKIREDAEKFEISENITPDEFAKHKGSISTQYETIAHLQASINYISKMILPALLSKHTSDLNSKVQNKIVEKINESEIASLDEQIVRSTKAASSPLSMFGGKKKIANAIIAFCNAKKNNVASRSDLGNCNALESAKAYLGIHPNAESLKAFIESVEKLPKDLTSSKYNSIYHFTVIDENSNLETIETNTFAEETKKKNESKSISSFKDSLSADVANRDIDVQIDSLNGLAKSMPRLNKDERYKNILDKDISDILGQ